MSRPAEQLGTPEYEHAAAGPAILDRVGPSGVAIVGRPNSPMVSWFLEGVSAHLGRRGYAVARPSGRDARHLPPDAGLCRLLGEDGRRGGQRHGDIRPSAAARRERARIISARSLTPPVW